MSWTSALPNWMQVPPPDGRSESQIEDDLDDEIGFHLEQIERELCEAGQDAEGARGLARLRFGDVETVKRRCRRIALKERVMLQRVNFVMMAVVMLLVIGVAVQVMTTQRYNTLALQAITTEITNMKYNAVAADRDSGTRVRNADDKLAGEQRGFVYLDGAVQRPGQYELPAVGQLTLRRLVAAAGGFKGNTVDMTVIVTQLEADGTTRVRTQVERLAREGTEDVALKPNDNIRISYAAGEETSPARQARNSFNGGLPDENCMWREVDESGKLVESGATIEYRDDGDVRNLAGCPTGILRLPGRAEPIDLAFRPPQQSRDLEITVGPKRVLSHGRWQLDERLLIINIAPGVPEIAEPLRFVQESPAGGKPSAGAALKSGEWREIDPATGEVNPHGAKLLLVSGDDARNSGGMTGATAQLADGEEEIGMSFPNEQRQNLIIHEGTGRVSKRTVGEWRRDGDDLLLDVKQTRPSRTEPIRIRWISSADEKLAELLRQ